MPKSVFESLRMDSPSARGHGDPALGTTTAESAAWASVRGGPAAEDQSPPQQPESPTTAGPAAVERFWEDLRKLRAALELLIAARRDQLKLSLRRAFLLSVVIGLTILMAAILAACACVMIIVGIAGGIGEFVGSVWLGQLITGGGLVVGGGLLSFLLLRMAQRRSRRKTLERYGKVAQ